MKQPTQVGRKMNFERTLCEAMRGRFVVELRYGNNGTRDISHRVFEPHAVYETGKDNIAVTGLQTSNPSKPLDKASIRNFFVGNIVDLRVTDRKIDPTARIDRTEARFAGGILCGIN